MNVTQPLSIAVHRALTCLLCAQLLVLTGLAAPVKNAAADATFAIDNIVARDTQSNLIALPINLIDSPSSAGFNVEVRLPEGLTVANVLPGDLLDAGGGFNLSYRSIGGGVRVLAYSATTALSGSGSIATLQLDVADTFAYGQEFAITFAPSNPDPLVNSQHALSNTDGSESLSHAVANGSLWLYTNASDGDADGLPDYWEIINDIDPRSADGDSGGAGDADADGVSNLDEFLTGTDPNDGQSAPPVVNGVNYLFFRDEFDNSLYDDRWTEADSGIETFVSSTEFTVDTDPVQTLLVTTIGKPVNPGDCTTRVYKSIATLDIGDAVLEAIVLPDGTPFANPGFGTTSFGLAKADDLSTRVEVQLDMDQVPYLTVQAFEAGTPIVASGAADRPPMTRPVAIRLIKNGADYDVLLNGVYQTSIQNLTLGDVSLRPFVAAESCSEDSGDVLSFFERYVVLRDSDSDGLADLYEDANLNGIADDQSDFNLADSDSDMINDGLDNCVADANTVQLDGNLDGFGNRCDADLNDDCVVNFVDLGLFRNVFFSASPIGDFNVDGVVNFVDLGIFRTLFFNPPGPSGTQPLCDGDGAAARVTAESASNAAESCRALIQALTGKGGGKAGTRCDGISIEKCRENMVDWERVRADFQSAPAPTSLFSNCGAEQ